MLLLLGLIIYFTPKVYGAIRSINIEPRYPIKEKIYARPMQTYASKPKTTYATEEDWYEAGITARDVVVNGKNCLEKKDAGIYWCEN